MTRYLFTLLVPFAMLGCPGDKDSGACESGDTACGGDADTDTDTDTDSDSDPTFSASWSASGVTITITGGSGSYELGMAETDAASTDPWTGEDCMNGYTTDEGDLLLYCHPMSSTGVALSTCTAETDYCDAGHSITEGSDTLFSSALSNVITYAAWDEAGSCWTWGHDTSYYTGEGCTAQ